LADREGRVMSEGLRAGLDINQLLRAFVDGGEDRTEECLRAGADPAVVEMARETRRKRDADLAEWARAEVGAEPDEVVPVPKAVVSFRRYRREEVIKSPVEVEAKKFRRMYNRRSSLGQRPNQRKLRLGPGPGGYRFLWFRRRYQRRSIVLWRQ
jgi:hypothetical protein